MEPINTKVEDVIKYIYADQIIEPLDAMRSDFDEVKLTELAESIKQNGLINPITVRPSGEKFEIVAGHRRYLACCRVPLSLIPCVVKRMSDAEVYSLRAHENLFRDDVDPVDEALYIGRLAGEDVTKLVSIAKALNRSISWVEDRYAILAYPEYFLPALKAGAIKLGVAKALAQIEDEYYRQMFFDNALRDGMTVWTADYYLSQWKAGVFKKGEEIMPPDPAQGPAAIAIVRQPCAKCGTTAEAPNLTNVFIHVTCPEDHLPMSSK